MREKNIAHRIQIHQRLSSIHLFHQQWMRNRIRTVAHVMDGYMCESGANTISSQFSIYAFSSYKKQ